MIDEGHIRLSDLTTRARKLNPINEVEESASGIDAVDGSIPIPTLERFEVEGLLTFGAEDANLERPMGGGR
jgi:hypothetical protein